MTPAARKKATPSRSTEKKPAARRPAAKKRGATAAPADPGAATAAAVGLATAAPKSGPEPGPEAGEKGPGPGQRALRAAGQILGAQKTLLDKSLRVLTPLPAFEDVFDQRVAAALQRLGLPDPAELARLRDEVDQLKQQIGALDRSSSGDSPKRATRGATGKAKGATRTATSAPPSETAVPSGKRR